MSSAKEKTTRYTWEELRTWRWGEHPETPGIDAPRSTANLVAILTESLKPENDPYTLAEREAIQHEQRGPALDPDRRGDG